MPVAMTTGDDSAVRVAKRPLSNDLKRTLSNCSVATSIFVFGRNESLCVVSSADARESVAERTWCRAQVDETWVIGPEPLSWCRLQ